ncbi:Uncharacterized protein FWK35_00010537, partial [Aphis craccivora]
MMCVFFFFFLCVSVYSITSRNNDPISNFGGWFPIFQKNREKQKKKMTEKREFLRRTSFRPS